MDNGKVFVGLPCAELARYTNFWRFFQEVTLPPGTVMSPPMQGLYPANGQNALARLFLKTDCEWFWLVNDDQWYPQETLLHLLSRDVDIVGPLCLGKDEPHHPLMYAPETQDGHFPIMYLDKGDRGLLEVGAIGGGGMLIRRKVFEAIPDPWWDQHMVQTEGTWLLTSEDFDFCKKASAAGFRIYCDLDVTPIHETQYGVRAVRDERGNWGTMLVRRDEEIVIPAARIPTRLIVPA